MSRLAFGLIIGGGFLGYYGFQEYQVGAGASNDAVHVELADLEAGTVAPDNHLQIGEHWAIFPAWVGWGTEETDQLDYIYYPIVSEHHPYNQEWDQLLAQFGDREIPEANWPQLKSLSVLVKSDRYVRSTLIPAEWKQVGSITGLLVHEIEQLKSGEEKLLRETYPFLPLADVMILEENRKPKSGMIAMGFMVGGAALLLGGVGMLGRVFWG